MAEQERPHRAESTETIGDNPQDRTNVGASARSGSSASTSSDAPADSSSRSQRSTADDLDDSIRARGNDSYGEVY